MVVGLRAERSKLQSCNYCCRSLRPMGLTPGEVSMIQFLRYPALIEGLLFKNILTRDVNRTLSSSYDGFESLRWFTLKWWRNLPNLDPYLWSLRSSAEPRGSSFSTVKRLWFHHIFLVRTDVVHFWVWKKWQERKMTIFHRMTGLKWMFCYFDMWHILYKQSMHKVICRCLINFVNL